MTIFEKIIAREIPADIVHEDALCLAFRDIQPHAPSHLLVIPKKAIPRIAEAAAEDKELLGHLFLVASRVAEKEGIAKSGYRIVVNCGADGGETVPHLHIHILGGRPLAWPPG